MNQRLYLLKDKALQPINNVQLLRTSVITEGQMD